MKAAALGFLAGSLVTWLLMTYGPPKPAMMPDEPDIGVKPDVTSSRGTGADGTAERRVATKGGIPRERLRVPIDGADVDAFKGGFTERRDGRAHEAVDILAPRNTPVHAVADGTIAKLFYSKGGGGITLYEFDETGRLAYYYAHLQRYADDIREGRRVSKGDVIGYVGTSGNAPPNTPHLHFAVFELDADRRWWKGRAIDPYPLFKRD